MSLDSNLRSGGDNAIRDSCAITAGPESNLATITNGVNPTDPNSFGNPFSDMHFRLVL